MTIRPWTIVGFVGQALFFSRFLVQWLASERLGRTIVPRAFWWFSLTGGALTLVYAIAEQLWPIILGQVVGLLVYTRNLMLSSERRSFEEGP
jgi:lipid-A-disaccharide synthase-like uncharacterized protein